MYGNSLKQFKSFIQIIFLILTLNSLVWAENTVNAFDKDSFGLAIKGYDSVAYFTDGKAVKGNEKFSFSWNEALWYFSSAEHRELFAANPKKYAPNRGGW